MLYMFQQIFSGVQSDNSTETITEDNFTNAIEYAKKMYDDNTEGVTNAYFTLVYEKVSETETEYVVKYIAEINTDADFSQLKGTSDSIANDLSNSISGIMGGINTNNTINNQTANITKLPQTGERVELVDILKILIVVCIVSIFVFSIYVKKNKS